jgi:glycosyltransferase involved in cell wall biosynthesis
MKRKLKIAVLASNLMPIPPRPKEIPPQWSGAPEKIISQITEGLVKRGHKVFLFASGDSRTKAKLISVVKRATFKDENLKKVGERFWVHSSFLDSLLIARAFEMAKGNFFDLIHSHFYNFLPAIFFTPFVKIPSFCTLHDFLGGTRKKILEEFKNSQYYISISNSQRRPLPKLNYVATIYHGVNLKKIPFGKKAENFLIFAGRIHPDKGVKEAIELAKRVKKKILIFGSHTENDYWKKEIKPEIDGRRIIYKGYLPEKEYFKFLKKALAFVFPLRWEEPFGLTVVEAMAAGTPVIAFDRGSMPEIIKDRRTGFLTKTIEEMAEKIKEIKEIKREDCRNWVKENFTIEKMVENYEKVFYKILYEKT